LTLPCKFEGSERLGSEREKDVNQIYVDTDIPVVELRVAQTMGTLMSIVLDRLSGSMVWSWADETGSRAYRYLCKP
jgi:hypothetical protein